MNSRISLHTDHGPLTGELTIPPQSRGLVILAHAGTDPDMCPDAHPGQEEAAFATILRRAGLATLTIDLLTHQEDRFPDAHSNVPLLAKRLLDCLNFLKRQSPDELAALPIGLCGSGFSSPAVLRVAALRDKDILAVVCRGGLIDLAGVLYLHSLQAPILILADADNPHLAASNNRALQEISCRKELSLLHSTPDTHDRAAHEAERWFIAAFKEKRS